MHIAAAVSCLTCAVHHGEDGPAPQAQGCGFTKEVQRSAAMAPSTAEPPECRMSLEYFSRLIRREIIAVCSEKKLNRNRIKYSYVLEIISLVGGFNPVFNRVKLQFSF